MASAVDLVLQNFIYRIESISPNEKFSRRKLRHNPRPLTLDPDGSSGMVRSFYVYFDGSEDAHEVTDIVERWHDVTFTVEVAYPVKSERGEADVQRLLLRDRHEMLKTLRDTSSYDGISASSPSTETYLHRREFMGDEVDRDDPITWIYRQEWGCTIQEIE